MIVILHTEPESLAAAGLDVSDFVIPAGPDAGYVEAGGIGSDLEHDEAMEPLEQDSAVVEQDSAEPELVEQRVLPDVEEREERATERHGYSARCCAQCTEQHTCIESRVRAPRAQNFGFQNATVSAHPGVP